MTANERRAEIMRILTARRSESMTHLAEELRVTTRTIRSDILTLTADYPLETVMGRHGCVQVAEWYHPHRSILSAEQQAVLAHVMTSANAHEREVLRQMLIEYGSPKARQICEGGDTYAG